MPLLVHLIDVVGAREERDALGCRFRVWIRGQLESFRVLLIDREVEPCQRITWWMIMAFPVEGVIFVDVNLSSSSRRRRTAIAIAIAIGIAIEKTQKRISVDSDSDTDSDSDSDCR